jgi:UDP-N-acetylglucosamine 2-epimerase
VTTEAENRRHLEDTLRAVSSLDMPVIWIWPNPDAGTGEMADSLRHFRENVPEAVRKMRFITDVPVHAFIALLKVAACLIGNSSAGIKECSYLGTPVVNIGARQQGRLHAENVVHAGYDGGEILAAVRSQIAHGRYAPSSIYYRAGASQAIVDVLAGSELYTQKRFFDSAATGART